MFLGTFTPKLDDKGRLILPSKFRDDLAEGLVITRGQERCLYVFSESEFSRMHDRIREAPITSKLRMSCRSCCQVLGLSRGACQRSSVSSVF